MLNKAAQPGRLSRCHLIDEGGEDSGKSWAGGYRAERKRVIGSDIDDK
jgi:hypothetical protein